MLQTLGRVLITTPGTPVRATANEADPAARFTCHGLLIQALPANTGRIYIGKAGMNKASHAGLHAILAIPTSNILPTFSVALTLAPAAVSVHDIFLDADVANDGVIITTLIT